MGLYDDNDENVTRLGGGWAAASQQANRFKIEQQKREFEIREQKIKMAQMKQAQVTQNKFIPTKMSQPKSLMTPPNIRPSNINKSKVPVPSYRAIQQANRAAAEQLEQKNEKRDVIDRFPDEYDPLKPNDFTKFLKRRREGKHKISKYAHFKKTSEKAAPNDSQGNDSSSSDEELDNRRKAAGMGKAMIAPPQQLYVSNDPLPNMAKKPTVGSLGVKLGMTGPLGPAKSQNTLFGGNQESSPAPGSPNPGLSIAEKIMAKYGHKEGSGLGRSGQGMATPLEVEKTSRRGGKIIAGKPSTSYSNFNAGGAQVPPTPTTPQPPINIRKLPNLSKPTKIVCLQNMVDRDEIDEELPDEVTSECSKYGQVVRVQICEIPNVPKEQEVRIFLEFTRMEEAMKAVIGLHNRFFSGRNLNAAFYDVELYLKGELTEATNG